MHCVTDPFGYRHTGSANVCIPDLLDLPSQKLSIYSRVTFAIGTNGFGFITFNPWAIANIFNAVATTTAAFTGSSCYTPNQTAVPGGVSQLPYPNTPYTSLFNPRYRLVAAGLKCRYTGTELNRGGTIAPVSAVAPGDNLAGSTMASVLSRPLVEPEACDRKWHGVFYKPLSPDDYTYQPMDYRIAGVVNTDAYMGIVATGTAGNTYEAEFIGYYELTSVGAYKVVSTTRSDADLLGLGIVRDAISGFADSALGQSAYQAAVRYAKEHAYQYAQTAVPMLMHSVL